MAGLVEFSDVQVRLSEIPKMQVPSSVTPERLQGYITEATGHLLTASGYVSAPVVGTLQRDVLNGLCVRLVVNMVQHDLFSMDADMAEMLRRERKDLLEEASKLAPQASGGAAQFFEMAGAKI